MKFAGRIDADAPDPQIERTAWIRENIPVPLGRFVAQPHLESLGWNGYAGNRESAYTAESLQLWRHPEDPDDERNAVAMDDAIRAELEIQPFDDLPHWLVEARRRLRFPLLRETVRTTWRSDGSLDPAAALNEHRHQAQQNHFGDGIDRPLTRHGAPEWVLTGGRPPVQEEVAVTPTTIRVDGENLPAVTAPDDRYATVGAFLPTGGVITVVIARAALEFVTMEFETARP